MVDSDVDGYTYSLKCQRKILRKMQKNDNVLKTKRVLKFK